MTAERDRLAALLSDLFPVVSRSWWPFTVEQAADALIAAGVGFRGVGVEEVIAQAQANLAKSEAAADREITRLRALVEQQPDLDVDRLARALVSETSWTPSEAEVMADAIAAAYREDAG